MPRPMTRKTIMVTNSGLASDQTRTGVSRGAPQGVASKVASIPMPKAPR